MGISKTAFNIDGGFPIDAGWFEMDCPAEERIWNYGYEAAASEILQGEF